jgi:HlyD family secretion protein
VKKRLILIVFVVLLIGVGTLVYWGQRKERAAELYYSGTIEATQANLSFQVGGRVTEVPVDEGQAVEAGQLLAVLERDSFLAGRDQALANLTRAEETLNQMQSLLALSRQALPAEVERAEAAVKTLEAQLKESETGYRSQDVQQARLALEEARITMEQARKDQARFEQLFKRNVIAEKDKDAADLKYQTAMKEYQRARQAFALLKEGYRQESIEAARARLAETRAALKLARSNLQKIEATEKEVAAARAQVKASRAAVELAEIQLSHSQLRAPSKGIIVSRNVEPGEVVSIGQEVISLADLSQVDLKVFVDETEIGKVKPGQPVDVKIDTFPDKIYPGSVSFISPEGEFTPKIIQTRKERVKLVYLVKIKIPNPEFELKSGMPADAWFR